MTISLPMISTLRDLGLRADGGAAADRDEVDRAGVDVGDDHVAADLRAHEPQVSAGSSASPAAT
jgi:hypothetical protein